MDATALTQRLARVRARMHAAAQRSPYAASEVRLVVVTKTAGTDVALSYRLLRYANSPAIGLARAVESVEQAVMVLGRAELRRWLGVMLLNHARPQLVSAALQEHALATARFFELLARQREGA